MIRLGNDDSTGNGRQVFANVIAAQTAELLFHGLRPVLRTGLVAVHADALNSSTMGTYAIDNGFCIALPVQVCTLYRQFVALHAQSLGTTVFGMTTRGDRHETHQEPVALWSIRPCHGAIGCHLVRQVHDVVGMNHLSYIIIRCMVGLYKFRYQTGLLLPFVYAGTG